MTSSLAATLAVLMTLNAFRLIRQAEAAPSEQLFNLRLRDWLLHIVAILLLVILAFTLMEK